MAESLSYIKRTVERVRTLLDEVATDGKYDDIVILNTFVAPAVKDIMSRLHNTSQRPVVCKYDFTLPANETSVTLPPCMQQVWRVFQLDANGNPTYELRRSHDLALTGYGYRVEGHTFTVEYPVTQDTPMRVLYLHNGDAYMHYSGTSNKGTAASSGTPSVSIVSMSTSPELGQVDRNVNAYGGQLLRAFPTTGLLEVRNIESYTFTSGAYKATLRDAFDVVDGSIEYEIVPPGPSEMWDAVAYKAAMTMGGARSITEKKMRWLSMSYMDAAKTLLDGAGNFDGRDGKFFTRDTIDDYEYLLLS